MNDTLPRFEKSHGKSEAEIRRRILKAVFEQRMRPGERLTEEQLATAFDVSRTVVRQAMARLAQDGILEKLPNVGSTVASPSRKQTRDILAIRKMVEPEIVRSLAAAPSGPAVARLRAHLLQEFDARKRGDRGTLVRLTGEFHLLLAELAGNELLTHLMTGLQALTCLAILLHAEREDACPPDEHGTIVAAIEVGDGEAAAAQMLHHLRHVEKDLHLDRPEPESALAWLRGSERERI
ncbi:GntR family transcriptional regulator [Mesorhizobium sp. M7A.F.Ca.US.006.01.1.1]|uniref:GntR family transcriptional regulator n=1 Tax=Mesorhizobium sp. M7A.F.Ca.US.006.01.1.1 TaxID=2496707 RepID=UPI0013E2CD6C|nr:GntR family transcriptional regulator [Mesorhizobium sp. M7A.F.Ca.US.006.01.1.1]